MRACMGNLIAGGSARRLALPQPLRGGEFAGDYALFEEMPFHRIACECEGGQKVFVRVLVLSALKLKLAKRSEIERISGEAFWIANQLALEIYSMAVGGHWASQLLGQETALANARQSIRTRLHSVCMAE